MLKFLVVTGTSLGMLTAAVAADLPRAQPVYQQAQVGKAPIGKAPVGKYPVGAIQMMAAIAERTEPSAPYREWQERRVRRDRRDPAYTIAYTACRAAYELGLAALVCPTLSGRSARLISAHRPAVPIYALSPGRETVRRCGLMWGVQAASMKRFEVTEELVAASAARVVELGWVKPGERVGITAGLPSGKPGTTSLLQIQEV